MHISAGHGHPKYLSHWKQDTTPTTTTTATAKGGATTTTVTTATETGAYLRYCYEYLF